MTARPLHLVVALLLGWSLACAGPPERDSDAETPPTPDPKPAPAPAPPPRPSPAPNAGSCATFEGVSLPLADGVITRCDSTVVHIDHDDPAKTRWEYSKAFQASGWRIGDPVKAAPTVTRDNVRLIFQTQGRDVVIKRL